MTDNSFDKALNAITEAAKLAINDKDYISYSTVLDIYLSNPKRYTEQQRSELLNALYNVLKENDDMVYEIGWDLPQLLVQYLSTMDMKVSFKQNPFFPVIFHTFNLLGTKGNFKELFLKAAEGIHQLRVRGNDQDEDDDEADLEDFSDNEEDYDDSQEDAVQGNLVGGRVGGIGGSGVGTGQSGTLKQQTNAVNHSATNTSRSADDINHRDTSSNAQNSATAQLDTPSTSQPSSPQVSDPQPDMYDISDDELDDKKIEQLFDVKFYCLYELLLSCIKNIKTQYPSRFLASTVSACLACLTTNISQFSILSVGLIMRRYFVLIRDYSLLVSDTEVSEDEMRMQRKLLGILLTWTIRICLDRFSVQWSQRLFYEMKAGLAREKSESVRKQSYKIALHTFRLTQIMERFSQTAYSFDIDPLEEFKRLIDQDDVDIDAEAAGGTFSSLSSDGLILLATQAMFDSRDESIDISFTDIIKLSVRLLERDGDIAPLGIQDALSFWGLWTSQDVKSEEIQAIDKETLFRYLQHVMLMCTRSNDKTNRYSLYSLSMKILSLSKPETAFEYLTDTLAYCPYETIKDAAVRMLKCLCLKEEAVDQLADKLNASSINSAPKPTGIIQMTPERRTILQDLIDKTLNEVEQSGQVLSESLPIFLSWVNFATIIPLDTHFIEEIIKRGRLLGSDSKLTNSGMNDEIETRKTIVNISLDSLEKREKTGSATNTEVKTHSATKIQ